MSDLDNLTKEELYEKAIEAIKRFSDKIEGVRKSLEQKYEKLAKRHIELLNNCSCPDSNKQAKNSYEQLANDSSGGKSV